MKKRLLAILMLALMLCSLFISCTNEDDIGGSSGGNTAGDSVFSRGSTVTVVSSSSELASGYADSYSEKFNNIVTTLKYSDSVLTVKHVGEGDSVTANEIVVGPTSRAISQKAQRALGRVRLTADEEADCLLGYSRWCIYAEGGSLAVNYDADEYGAAMIFVTEKLIDDYLFGKSELSLSDGVVESGYVDIYAYLDARDGEEVEAQWASLKNVVGEEITQAFRNLYELYSDSMLDWMANLWEPYTCACDTEECTKSSMYCGGAAFYYSNSARNTVGYLPDSESTRQILAFLESSGMIGNYATALPDDMKVGIIRFLKSLQDPESGYFYHPQWGDSISDSRRGRDLGDCTDMLRRLGSRPTYDAPDGTKGDGILADGTAVETAAPASALTDRLKGDMADAVSKVVPTASTIPQHLVDKDSFETYLDSQNIRTNSYAAGNTLASQIDEIKYRDTKLKEEGADYSLVDILIKFLNDNQNPDTGTWDWPMENDQRGVYHANNGVLKISYIYNATRTLMPNYAKMITNAVDTLLSEDDPYAVTDIYNVWYALSMIKTNIEMNGGTEGKTHFEAFQAELLNNAVTLIDATKQKLSIFLKPDGSFSYHPQYSSSVSQSAPTAVPQSEEGDVNATTICCTGTLSTMFNTFGLSNYMPAVYTNVDWLKFVDTIEDFGKVIKDEIPAFEAVASGDENKGKGKYYENSLKFDNKTFSELVQQGYFYSQDDLIKWDRIGIGAFVGNTKVNDDKVMVYGKKSGSSPYLYINMTNEGSGNALVFETDICLLGGTTTYDDGGILQFWLDDSNITDTVMWWDGSFSVKLEPYRENEEGDLIGQHSFAPTMKSHVFDYGTWHNIRLEVQNSALSGSEIRFYLDNVLINRKYVTTPKVGIDHMTVRFRGDSGADAVVLLDNTFFSSFNTIEKDDSILLPDNIIIKDSLDEIDNEKINGSGANYDKSEHYSDTNVTTLGLLGKIGSQDNKVTPDSVTAGYHSAIYRINGNEALLFGKKTTGDPYVFFYAENNQDASDKSLVFETDFAFVSGTAPGRADNTVMQWFASNNTKNVSHWYGIGLSILLVDGKYYLKGGSGNTAMSVEIDPSSWYNIRIEVDDASKTGSEARVYINGELKSTFNTTSGVTYVESMMVRFMSQCTDGRIYFDNTYMRASTPPKVDEEEEVPPSFVVDSDEDYYGKGEYYDDSISYTDATHESLISSGLMAENKVNGVGKNKTLSFADGVMKYSSSGSSWGAINFVKQGTDSNIVFETDMKIEGAYISEARASRFVGTSNNGTGSAGRYGFTLLIYSNPDISVGGYILKIVGTVTSKTATALIPEGQWVNIRYEFDGLDAGSATRLYVNGELAIEATSKDSISGIAGVEMLHSSDSDAGEGFSAGTISFDNTYCGHMISEATPTPNPGDGEDSGEWSPKVEVLPVKGGATGAFVFMHDDGSPNTAAIIDPLLSKYGLGADLALLLSNVYDFDTQTTKSAYAGWKSYLQNGRWKLVSHSATHTWFGTVVDGAPVEDADLIKKEVVTSQEILRNLFPGQKVLTFAYPGYSSELSAYGYDATFTTNFKNKIIETYISGRRANNNPINEISSSTKWEELDALGLDYDKNTDKALAALDTVSTSGGLAIFYCHRVAEVTKAEIDAGYTYPTNTMSSYALSLIFEKASGLVNSGKIWNAHYEDAVMYLREAQNASVTISGDETSLSVTLTDTLDNSVYNYPLTVRIAAPASWTHAKIVQGETTSYVAVTTVNGKAVIDADIIPDGGIATVTPIAAADFPVEEEPDEVEDYLGKGEYYDNAINYTDATHDSLIASGDMYNNTNFGIGTNRTLSFTDGAMHYTATAAATKYGAIDFANKDTSATALVFETDIMFSNAVFTDIRFVGSSNTGTGSAGLYGITILFAPNSSGGYDVKIKDASAGTYPVVAVIPESTWVNLRYEFDGTTSGSAVRLYFNGELTIETTLTGTVTGIKGLELLVEKNFSSGTISLDNTYLGPQKTEE
ncbi:MAG: polysaccharide deacetylase family protein [Clostridia bacterium]|nr:polysaccharide deacetylase family protein [Clostridia bacterium]